MGTPLRTNKQKEVERIIESLSRAVAQHLLPPGTRLVEAQIVDSLNANRNHVQAALQRLALQKIVTIAPMCPRPPPGKLGKSSWPGGPLKVQWWHLSPHNGCSNLKFR